MTRRKALSAAAPAGLMLTGSAGIASAAPGPDADLLALCTRFHRLHAEGGNEANPDWEKSDAAAWDTFERIEGMMPVTEAGHRAKAAVAAGMLAMFHSHDPVGVFALQTIRGWLGRTA